MRVSRSLVLAVAFLTAACGTTARPAPSTTVVPATTAVVPASAGLESAVATITAADVHRHLVFLASDELRGRDTPSPGLEQAAEYIADHFRDLGLQPAGDDGSYIQRFPFEQVQLDRAALRVEARGAGGTLTPAFGTDLFVLPAEVDSVVGVPLFAGIARPGMQLGREATGRIVVFFVPDTLGEAWQRLVGSALQSAAVAGAGAAVIVLDSLFGGASLAMLADQLASQLAPLPIIGISYDAARPIFAQAGLQLGAARGSTSATPTAMQGVTLALRTPVRVVSALVPNVVAVLPGSDPGRRDEHVVFSAHFDHVGVGAPDATGDSIYNGADDNASGTSAVLEIARAFVVLDRAPARSVMFVLVSGEEKGLLGSAFFVDNAPIAVESMVANINLDMIGRNAPDTVVAIGQDYSTLGPRVQAVAARHPELGLVVAPDLWPEEQLFFRSDHFSFAAREVPAIFFTTGLHDEYHRPGDEVHLIDTDKVVRISRLLFRFAHDIANSPDRPQWTQEGLAEVRRATSGAF
jgi:hypothetical protein